VEVRREGTVLLCKVDCCGLILTGRRGIIALTSLLLYMVRAIQNVHQEFHNFQKNKAFQPQIYWEKKNLTVREQMIENRCEVFFLPLYFLLKSLVFLKSWTFGGERRNMLQ